MRGKNEKEKISKKNEIDLSNALAVSPAETVGRVFAFFATKRMFIAYIKRRAYDKKEYTMADMDDDFVAAR